MGQPIPLATLALLGAFLLAFRALPQGVAERAARGLRHRAAPWIIGAVTALGFWWVAGATLEVEPISTDEASYLLQARIFAAGAVTAPAPPLPEFFEQPWVVVTPRIYSKYPPGNALVLAPGVALGLPWLMPLLLAVVNGALLFAILRRTLGPAAALLTWSAWILSLMAMSWQTSYFSQVPLMACWLGALVAAARWTAGGSRRWIVLAGLLLGYGAITRPLSILLLSIPLGAGLLRTARSQGRRRELGAGALAFATVLCLLPAWNLGTTGRVTRSPLREYTETYLPWDRLGFAIDSTAPRRDPPPELQFTARQLVRIHREHTVQALPRTLLLRAHWLERLTFTGWRLLLIATAVIGIWMVRGPAAALLAAAVCQFLGHAVWAHEAGWTLYYAESAALWYIPGALGVTAALTWAGRRLRPPAEVASRVELAVLLALPVLLLLSAQESTGYRAWRARRVGESLGFSAAIAAGPDRAIYFVRPGPERSGRPGSVRNDPWLSSARAWIVYDRGRENDALRRLAPDRVAFLVDVGSHRITPLPPLAAGP